MRSIALLVLPFVVGQVYGQAWPPAGQARERFIPGRESITPGTPEVRQRIDTIERERLVPFPVDRPVPVDRPFPVFIDRPVDRPVPVPVASPTVNVNVFPVVAERRRRGCWGCFGGDRPRVVERERRVRREW